MTIPILVGSPRLPATFCNHGRGTFGSGVNLRANEWKLRTDGPWESALDATRPASCTCWKNKGTEDLFDGVNSRNARGLLSRSLVCSEVEV